MRPRDLVAEAKRIAKLSERISVKVLDETAMKDLGMGSLLSVSRGSAEPAYLIHLVYKPKKKAGRKVCLVGKGLTFDAGGISLKPSPKMEDMKYDMSGGAAVLGTFQALAELAPNGVEVHGLVPASENLPDGKANKPGDLVTAMNGMTIEILNTDAEGRLILADALAYAVAKIKPDAMIDLATLTGAVITALGHELSGLMGNDQSVIDALIASGKRTGEQVWPLPLHDCHKREMKGRIGDLKNTVSPGFGAGSSGGGAFLSNFVGEVPWAHLDIAGSAWGAEDRDYQGGALGTGVGVRLLVDYLENSAT
jgi:leucyl aminopeptidase